MQTILDGDFYQKLFYMFGSAHNIFMGFQSCHLCMRFVISFYCFYFCIFHAWVCAVSDLVTAYLWFCHLCSLTFPFCSKGLLFLMPRSCRRYRLYFHFLKQCLCSQNLLQKQASCIRWCLRYQTRYLTLQHCLYSRRDHAAVIMSADTADMISSGDCPFG